MVILVQFKVARGYIRTEQALINSRVERNYIKQLLSIECNQKAIEDSLFLVIVKGKKVITYRNYNINIIATNSKDTTKTHQHSFVACDFDILDVLFILGFPWLQDVDLAIRWQAGTW